MGRGEPHREVANEGSDCGRCATRRSRRCGLIASSGQVRQRRLIGIALVGVAQLGEGHRCTSGPLQSTARQAGFRWADCDGDGGAIWRQWVAACMMGFPGSRRNYLRGGGVRFCVAHIEAAVAKLVGDAAGDLRLWLGLGQGKEK